ncbi:MAG: hypothetical protein ACLU9S_08990 [Oscillospiraceae bacterium]
MLAADFLTEGKAQVKGPSGVISKIDKLVAKVTAGEPIADAQVFSTELTAVDSEGKDVDLSECTFPDAAEGKGTVNVTVPVQVYRKVNFTYQLENVPEYYQGVTNFSPCRPPISNSGDRPRRWRASPPRWPIWANSILTT